MNQQISGSIEELTAQEVARLMHERRIVLIDVREPDEFAAQRIPGALLCPLSTLDATTLPPDGDRRVVFHCGSGKRSASAARARIAAGAARAAHLTGGIAAWTAAGLSVIRLDPSTGKPATT
jgi:rhodanese-related sulfurtransferase